MKKQLALVISLVGMVLLLSGFYLGRVSVHPKVQNVFPPKFHTEDMVPVVGNPKSITVTLVDSVDGRPTFYIEFPDSTGIDAMYAEEIAHGLATGVWDYNEDYTITASSK